MIDVNSIVEQCCQLLPSNLRQAPWIVLDHGRLVPETEDQLNAYIAAYGEMHMIKCRAALQNLPLQDFKLYGYEIFDWGCGQGIATLTTIEFLQERGLLGRLQRITLIEPSNAALSRAKTWVERYAGPGVEVRCVDRFIPNDTSITWDDVSCDARISINLFSNILDIRTLSLSWTAHKTASLAMINYMLCIGPCFTINTRIKDFCGFFQPKEYFSNIEQKFYAYTSRTHHAYGCETKCFVHKRDESVNDQYVERATALSFTDDYDYAADCQKGVVSDDVLDFYNRLRAECGKSFEIFFRPRVNVDAPEFILYNVDRGIIVLNVCKDIQNLQNIYYQAKNFKDFLFSTHLNSLKIDSVIHPYVYNCVKIAIYFPNSSCTEVEQQIESILASSEKKSDAERKGFEYLCKIYKSDDPNKALNRITPARGLKPEYYEELLKIIIGEWHSYRDGNQNFRLTKRQQDFVRNPSLRLRVKGVAGSGKTQVVANRAVEQHLRTGERVLILTFNITLIQYIRMRINQVPADFATNMFEITNYHQFFLSMANRYLPYNQISNEDYDKEDFFKPVSDRIEKYNTIIVDEAQDFKTSWLESIINYFLAPNGSLSVFGDGEQNIYNRTMDVKTKMPEIPTFEGRWGELSEGVSMRIQNPRIVSLASAFAKSFMDRDSRILPIQNVMDFNDYHIEYWNEGRTHNAQKLCDRICCMIQSCGLKLADIAILAASVNLLRDIEQYFSVPTMRSFESANQYKEVREAIADDRLSQSNIEDIRRVAKTHFTTYCDALKFSTIHSFKGWESKTIVLFIQPDEIDCDPRDYYIEAKKNTPALIYTALTRAVNNLFVINLGNQKYDSFFQTHIYRGGC